MSRINELELINTGYEECKQAKSFGPAIRSYFLFHYIYEGKGTYVIDNRKYELNTGQMFLIFPGDLTFYRADDTDPWVYAWIGFAGKGSSEFVDLLGLSRQDPILTIPCGIGFEDTLKELSSIHSFGFAENFYSISLMYKLFSKLLSGVQKQDTSRISYMANEYVETVKSYIRNNYQNSVTISNIAKMIGIDRTYLFTLFKKNTGKSIQRYLIDYRLEKAADLLTTSKLPVLETAFSVGYTDQFTFSKAFKKKYGLSPKMFTSDHSNNVLNSLNSQ